MPCEGRAGVAWGSTVENGTLQALDQGQERIIGVILPYRKTFAGSPQEPLCRPSSPNRRSRAATRSRSPQHRSRVGPSEPAPRAHRRRARRRTTAQQRVDAGLAALAANTRKAYTTAWSAWQSWAAEYGCKAIPATAADVAIYLEARHASGAAPATIRVARAAIAKVHQVSGLADPTVDSLCRDVLRRIVREGRNRGRGQVSGVGWAQAETAADRAACSGSVTRRSSW